MSVIVTIGNRFFSNSSRILTRHMFTYSLMTSCTKETFDRYIYLG